MNTPKSCPGWEMFKSLSSFECNCPQCGKVIEIFSDEFDKPRSCPKCGQPIDFTKVQLSLSGKSA